MGCGNCEPKKMAKYTCKACGKEELREEAKPGVVLRSCCGKPMEKKQE